ESGKLGEIQSFSASFSFPISKAAVDGKRNVRLDAELGGGSLWDVGIYPVSLAQYVMGGPPMSVWGSMRSEFGVDITFAGQMVYPGGKVAQFTSSFETAFQTQAEIRGSRGRLELTRPFTNTDASDRAMTFFPFQGDPEEILIENVEEYLYLGEVKDMNAAILDGSPLYLSPEETRNHVKTALALYESARQNTIVELN
ncbi:MAG: Gfo/Idh/MocA family oxidoreductase, partial [Chloroflexota bacterium]